MDRKISDRSKAIRTAGIRSGSTDHVRQVAEQLRIQADHREAGRIYEAPNGISQEAASVVCCPRCGKNSVSAKLNSDEEVDYCPSCRYTIPRGDVA